jgi:hypothetical protein
MIFSLSINFYLLFYGKTNLFISSLGSERGYEIRVLYCSLTIYEYSNDSLMVSHLVSHLDSHLVSTGQFFYFNYLPIFLEMLSKRQNKK